MANLNPFLAASLMGFVATALIFAYFLRRRARLTVEIISYRFALPHSSIESLKSYKIGSVLMSLPDTPEARALELVSGAEHYSAITLTNGMREVVRDCLLKLSFVPLYIQIRRPDTIASVEPATGEIGIGAIQQKESVCVEMWHVEEINRKTVRKSVSLDVRQDIPRKYTVFLASDHGGYHSLRIGKLSVLALISFILILEIAIALFWLKDFLT